MTTYIPKQTEDATFRGPPDPDKSSLYGHITDIFDPYADLSAAEPASAVLGIDLGTTHSVVGIIQGGTPTLVAQEGGSPLLPSIVAYTDDGQALVGASALAQLMQSPHSGIQSVKRLMSRDSATPLQFKGVSKTPVAISADILRSLKVQAEKTLGRLTTQAVITVPAYFDETARQATKEAARAAGLTVLRLINEPTAAALAYGLDQGVEGTYAVYDLGGGTFDVSLLTLTKGIFRVLATGGHTQLGGDDLDIAIAKHWGENSPSLAVLQIARQAKHHLSTHEDGSWTLPTTQPVHLSRPQLEALAQPFVDKTLSICQRVLRDAQVTPADVQGVILVGGATRMPLIRRCIHDAFGKEPLINLNPDEIVALGATLQAKALTQGSDNLLIDVTPLSLGIETLGGVVEKIINRNSPIPTSQTQAFTTYQDNQSAMKIHILQGEKEHVAQCRSLGEFILSGIPPMPAGAPRIEVVYRLDADGLLTVTAQEKTTSISQTIEVKPSYGLTEENLYTLLQENSYKGKGS